MLIVKVSENKFYLKLKSNRNFNKLDNLIFEGVWKIKSLSRMFCCAGNEAKYIFFPKKCSAI